MGMLVVRTMGILLTVVLSSDALTLPFLPPCWDQLQVHLGGAFGAERPYASVLTLLTGGHGSTSMCRWLQFKSKLSQNKTKQKNNNKTIRHLLPKLHPCYYVTIKITIFCSNILRQNNETCKCPLSHSGPLTKGRKENK